jgi:hypothetical protein
MSRINSDGTLNTAAACNLYAYTYPLDVTRIAKSIAITNAAQKLQTIAFALTLTGATTSASPSFTLSNSTSILRVAPGGSAASTITVAPANGFTGSVTLAATGLPSGVTAGFGSNPTTGTSVLTLTANNSATSGTAAVTITGTSGSLSATTTIALTVTALPSFTLGVSPAVLTVAQGGNGTSTITITSENSFNSEVSLSVSGLPAGVTAALSPTSITPKANGSAQSTLSLTTSSTSASVLGHRGRPLFPEAALAALLCCFGWKKRRRLQMLVLLSVSLIGLSLLNGCGSQSTPHSTTPTTATITVTATSGTLQQSTTILLTVN